MRKMGGPVVMGPGVMGKSNRALILIRCRH